MHKVSCHRCAVQYVTLVLVVLSLSGCGLLRGTPTPLPWLPTATPPITAAPQAENTATPETVETPTPTSTAVVTEPATATMVSPSPSPTSEPLTQVITLDIPVEGTSVTNPIQVRGQTKVMPFEGTLVIRVYDAQDNLVTEKPVIATGEFGGPAAFEDEVTVGGRPGPGRIEVVDLSPEDGSEIARAAVGVTLAGFPGGVYVELPAAQATVSLPIHLLARVGKPDQQVNVTITWDDGTQLAHVFNTLAGLDGRGLLVVPLDFVGTMPARPPTQGANIDIDALTGSPLASQRVHILGPDDPASMGTEVFWIVNETIVGQSIRILRTQGIGRASVEALLWGPVPQNSQGYVSLIPSPESVLNFPGRGPQWGERVRLQNLRIEDRVAYADFSIELSAHAGGALVTALIRDQIEATLTQFSTVDDVVISIDGVTGVLEP